MFERIDTIGNFYHSLVSGQVEVAFLGSAEKEENIKSDGAKSAAKPLPPWMIKQGMNLTEEQRGKVKVEAMTEGTSTALDSSDDKEQTTEEVNMKCLQARLI